MKSDTDKWLKELGELSLKEIGLKKGQIVLDFGCGDGFYTILAAKIVGDKGKVYALDKDRQSLQEVIRRAEVLNLKNIQPIETSGKVTFCLNDESIDVVLLYDVLHSYYFTTTARKELLTEIYRISKPNALISVYPKHMNLDTVKKEIETANFHFVKKLYVTLLHFYRLTHGYVLNFRRK